MKTPFSPTPHRPWRRAAGWLLLLAPLFYLSYGLANHWAANRVGVPSVVFAWERAIPFWAWTIFPYWSINLFYAVSLFLARHRHELDRNAARLLTAQLVAVTCFVLWPMRFAFDAPAVDGTAGFMFAALRGFDQPFNQSPSLHIALAVILWDWYRRRIHRSALRFVLHTWTLLICGSVLTTYQHHFIDIPTGALLGVVCVWLWPLERRVALLRAWRLSQDAQRRQLALVYAAGAALCLAAALSLGNVALWLAWPGVALLVMALNYAGFGTRGFQLDPYGRMGWAARWLLAPYRLGAALNARLWTRGLPLAAEIRPGLWIGRLPSQREWMAAGQPHMLSLCAELQAPGGGATCCLPLLDLTVPSSAVLRRAVLMLDERLACGEPVWICCALGFSRSAAVAVSWLATRGHARNTMHAQTMVRIARPQIVLPTPWQRPLRQAVAAHTRIRAT